MNNKGVTMEILVYVIFGIVILTSLFFFFPISIIATIGLIAFIVTQKKKKNKTEDKREP